MYIVLWLYSKYSQCFVGIKWLRFYFYPYGLAILSRRKVPVWLNTGIWEGWIYKHSLKTEWSLHPRWWRKLNYWIRTTNKEWDFEMHGWKDVSARGHSLSWSVKLAAMSFFLFSWQQEKLGDDPISTLRFLSIQLNIIFASQRLTTFWLQKTQGEKQTNLSSALNLLYLP